jgi:hypothetical protein
MTLQGTVVNGTIVLDGSPALPEGARVRVELADPLPADHPLAPYNRETELNLLRESIEDAKAGRGQPASEVMAEIAKEFDLPPTTSE